MPDIDRGALNQALAEALETAGRADLAYEPWTTCPECVQDDIRRPANCSRCGAEMVQTVRAFCTDLAGAVDALNALGLLWAVEPTSGKTLVVIVRHSEANRTITDALNAWASPVAIATALVQAAVTVLTKKASDA